MKTLWGWIKGIFDEDYAESFEQAEKESAERYNIHPYDFSRGEKTTEPTAPTDDGPEAA